MTLRRFLRLMLQSEGFELPARGWRSRGARVGISLVMLGAGIGNSVFPPLVAMVGAPLIVSLTLPRRWIVERLEELSLTALTREEILVAMLRPGFRAAAWAGLASLVPLPVVGLLTDVGMFVLAIAMMLPMAVGCWIGCYAVAVHHCLRHADAPLRAGVVAVVECTLTIILTAIGTAIWLMLASGCLGGLLRAPEAVSLVAGAVVIAIPLLVVPLVRLAMVLDSAERNLFSRLDADAGWIPGGRTSLPTHNRIPSSVAP